VISKTDRKFGRKTGRSGLPAFDRLRSALRPGEQQETADDGTAQTTAAANLLRMFEDSGKGWFWEIDRQGCLVYLSAALANLVGLDDEEWRGMPFTTLLAPEAAQNDGGTKRNLRFYLSARAAFSDIMVRANCAEETWWSLSGQPILDDCDRFFGFRGFAADLTAQRASEVELNRLATFDSLTNLANREMMRRFLEDAMVSASHRRQRCAVALMDLDRFKTVNDTLGHPAGDTLLKLVALRLQEVVRDAGQIGRIGGDEFQFVFPDFADEAELANIADDIIHRISLPYTIGSNTVSVGASIGIAVSDYDDRTAADLVRDADLALYAAKDAGKGVHRFYKPDMHETAQERQQLEADLALALERGELAVHYQPTVDVKSEQIVGFEALVRWQHPTRGWVSPAEFIPIAEERGMIGAIGAWVLKTACADAATWPGHIKVAVNLSPVQFTAASLAANVNQTLSDVGLPAERLELEITEGALLNFTDSVDQTIKRLKKIGVRLALDDFGTGYSSLGYLLKVPFDKIKIDQSFVRGAAIPGSKNSAIIKTVVALAEELSMQTTAEGVETHDDLSLMVNLGCTLIQGYIYGKPMPFEEASALVLGSSSLAPQGFTKSRPERTRLLRNGQLIYRDHAYPVRMRNISAGGAMLEGAPPLEEGAEVALDLGSGPIEAEVRWTRENQTGLQFREAVDIRAITQRPDPKPNPAAMLTPSFLKKDSGDDEAEAPGRKRKAG
jgi:diguanylate cyclase (GGDEF)-like protein/PAS domain S-box-containing protein